ncbi:EamA family transporter [Candidatus Berkiella aquae]|uniref:DMT family transporter n=1 Tax=Candidatus Berkiella aquae TaxID=295108 RepID=A0AAE3HWD2_9GAMM|nr:DMT family transporter [Candidatus Berkiella aquae]MCS5711868.1 DMT family transporter [Candidatus Berkiella aquae]
MHDLTVKRATYMGLGALIMWTVEPLLISEVNGLPIFEVLAIIFFSSFALTALRLTKRRAWHTVLKQPAFIWLAGLTGICLSDFAYIYGAQYAPIAHVDLIDYLWPCLVVAFTSMLPKERFTPQHIIGALLGLLGIYVLVHHEISLNGFNFNYFIGYLLALFGAVLWGGYSAFSRYFKKVPTEMIGMYCGLGALLCLGLHLKFETFVTPTWTQGSLAVVTGISGAGIAYQLWDYGVKYGDVYLLSTITYVARIAAMALLVMFGKEPLTWSLVIACSLASIGVFISGMDTKSFKQLCGRFSFMRSSQLSTQPEMPV